MEFVAAGLISLGSALVGGVVVHVLATRREKRAEGRRLRIELLVRAYQALQEFVEHDGPIRGEHFDRVNQALNDLSFLGTEAEIRLVELLFSSEGLDFTDLITSIRDDLRRELGLRSLEHKGSPPARFKLAPEAKSE